MIFDIEYIKKVSKRVLILVLSIRSLYIFTKLSIFYLPFLIAFIIASIIEPLVKYTAKHTKLERKVSAIIVLSIVSTIIIGLTTWGISSLISEASNLLQGLNEYTEKMYSLIQNITSIVDFSKLKIPEQVSNIFNNSTQDILNLVLDWIKALLNSILQTIPMLPSIGIYIVVTLLATYFICTDRLYILDLIEYHFPRTWVKRISLHINEILTSLGAYLKAQAILIIIDFIQILAGLFILKYIGMKIQYPFLAAIGIGFVDALPILGSGCAFIPWAVVSALNGDINLAIGILIIWIIITIVRQIIEPKIVSKQLGIHPIFTLIAMYTGFKLIGIIGLLVGPIAIIILNNIYGALIDKGVVKSIISRS